MTELPIKPETVLLLNFQKVKNEQTKPIPRNPIKLFSLRGKTSVGNPD